MARPAQSIIRLAIHSRATAGYLGSRRLSFRFQVHCTTTERLAHRRAAGGLTPDGQARRCSEREGVLPRARSLPAMGAGVPVCGTAEVPFAWQGKAVLLRWPRDGRLASRLPVQTTGKDRGPAYG